MQRDTTPLARSFSIMPSHNSISVNNCFIKTIAVCSIVAHVIIAAPLIWFFSSTRIIQATSAAEADRVVNLPGQPRVNFSHYAGYVALDDPDQKALFYWFFEAEEDPANKPLALWLHGGPGCSAVHFGAAQEVGPFLVQMSGVQLTHNAYSWNKVANLLFVESPVGVGFSYANNTQIYKNLSDNSTAHETYTFLIKWLKKFPMYKSRPFYVVGESYAGRYAPELINVIYEENKNASVGSYIDIRGFMVGNALINGPTDTQGRIEYAWSQGLISDQVHSKISKECDFHWNNLTKVCLKHMKEYYKAFDYIEVYGIYSPKCRAENEPSEHPHYNPCADYYPMTYLNRRDVQKALHANVTKLPYPYRACSIEDWRDAERSTLPLLRKLLKVGLRIWYYSGDTDARVPVTSTSMSLKELGLHMEEERRPWFYNHKMAGWVETYSGGLTFATIHGAGHQVPRFAPAESLALLTHFLGNQSLPMPSP